MKEKNFKFRKSFGALVEKMTDKQAGEFIKSVNGYVFNGKPLDTKDEYLKGIYIYVQSVLDTEMRDRANGKIGGAIVAEKRKKMKSRSENEDISLTETNVVSQLIIVSADAQGAVDKCGQSKKGNAYGGGKYHYEKKDDKKVV